MEQRSMAFHRHDMGQDGIIMFSLLLLSSLSRHRSQFDYLTIVSIPLWLQRV